MEHAISWLPQNQTKKDDVIFGNFKKKVQRQIVSFQSEALFQLSAFTLLLLRSPVNYNSLQLQTLIPHRSCSWLVHLRTRMFTLKNAWWTGLSTLGFL